MRKKLTARTVAALEPEPAPYETRDTEIKGFLLRVQPSGHMTYYLDYRTEEGRRNRYRIGTRGNITPEQARDIAKLRAGEVAKGADIQAERIRAKREAELAKKRTLGIFLVDVFAPWFTEHQRRSTDTVRRVKTVFHDLLSKSMADINPWLLEKWRTEERKRGKEPTTINRDIAALRAVLSKAVDWGYLMAHPLPRGKLKNLKTDELNRVRYLTDDEEKTLRDALDAREGRIRAKRSTANEWRRQRGYAPLPTLWDHEYADYVKPMVLVSLNTGLRRGEVFNLMWVNIDFHTKTITVEGETAKSGKTRHVPLNAEALEGLRRWKAQGTGTGLVFPGKGGKPLDNVQKAWEHLLSNAGISNFRFHDLRHSFASRLVMAGVDLNTVRELLGHGDIKMTLRYSHLAPEHKANAVERLIRTA